MRISDWSSDVCSSDLGVKRGFSAALRSAENRGSGIARHVAELFLDADQLVVFGEPVRAREAAGLDLSAIGRDREVGDRRILGLARTVRHDGGVAREIGRASGRERVWPYG